MVVRSIRAAIRSVARGSRPGRDDPMRLDLEDVEIVLYPTPFGRVLGKRAKAASKEPWTTRWIAEALGPGDVLWDVGANVGPYTLIAAKLHGPSVVVVAIEPAAPSFDALVRNVIANSASATVIPLCIALAPEDGLASFRYVSLKPGEGFNTILSSTSTNASSATDLVRSAGLRGDTLVERLHVPRPTHLKIDVEDGELDVIRGMARLLTEHPPKSMMVEVAGEAELDRMKATLASVGLKHRFSFWKSEPDGARDAFFAHEDVDLESQLAAVVAAERERFVAGTLDPG